MKSAIVSLVLLGTALSYAQWDDAPDELDLKIRERITVHVKDEVDQSWLTGDIKPLVIEKLLKMRSKPDPRYKMTAEGQLLAIGHIPTIESLVEEMQQPGNLHSNIEMFAREESIKYLMPLVYNGSTSLRTEGRDVTLDIDRSVRSRAAVTVLKVIRVRKSFPVETRKWAEELHEDLFSKDIEKRLDLLKQWWEYNQTAILEKRYADATWLPRYKGKPITYSPEEMAEGKADEERERTNREARRTGDSNTKPAAAEAPSTNSRFLWGIIVALVALLGIFIRWKFAGRRTS
jgi:hypothetical protein